MKQVTLTPDGKLNRPIQALNADFQKRWDEAVVNFVAKEHVSFNLVSGESMKTLISTITTYKTARTPKFKIKHGTTISRQVSKQARRVKADIVQIISHAKATVPSLAFTTDIWTSRNGDPFISLTIHFITDGFEMFRFVAYVKSFDKKHSAKNIKLELSDMMRQLRVDSIPT